jgi:hypothetical protein
MWRSKGGKRLTKSRFTSEEMQMNYDNVTQWARTMNSVSPMHATAQAPS